MEDEGQRIKQVCGSRGAFRISLFQPHPQLFRLAKQSTKLCGPYAPVVKRVIATLQQQAFGEVLEGDELESSGAFEQRLFPPIATPTEASNAQSFSASAFITEQAIDEPRGSSSGSKDTVEQAFDPVKTEMVFTNGSLRLPYPTLYKRAKQEIHALQQESSEAKTKITQLEKEIERLQESIMVKSKALEGYEKEVGGSLFISVHPPGFRPPRGRNKMSGVQQKA